MARSELASAFAGILQGTLEGFADKRLREQQDLQAQQQQQQIDFQGRQVAVAEETQKAAAAATERQLTQQEIEQNRQFRRLLDNDKVTSAQFALSFKEGTRQFDVTEGREDRSLLALVEDMTGRRDLAKQEIENTMERFGLQLEEDVRQNVFDSLTKMRELQLKREIFDNNVTQTNADRVQMDSQFAQKMGLEFERLREEGVRFDISTWVQMVEGAAGRATAEKIATQSNATDILGIRETSRRAGERIEATERLGVLGNETDRRGQDIKQGLGILGDQTTRRGQDLQASISDKELELKRFLGVESLAVDQQRIEVQRYLGTISDETRRMELQGSLGIQQQKIALGIEELKQATASNEKKQFLQYFESFSTSFNMPEGEAETAALLLQQGVSFEDAKAYATATGILGDLMAEGNDLSAALNEQGVEQKLFTAAQVNQALQKYDITLSLDPGAQLSVIDTIMAIEQHDFGNLHEDQTKDIINQLLGGPQQGFRLPRNPLELFGSVPRAIPGRGFVGKDGTQPGSPTPTTGATGGNFLTKINPPAR